MLEVKSSFAKATEDILRSRIAPFFASKKKSTDGKTGLPRPVFIYCVDYAAAVFPVGFARNPFASQLACRGEISAEPR
jgi:hypothetical protein